MLRTNSRGSVISGGEADRGGGDSGGFVGVASHAHGEMVGGEESVEAEKGAGEVKRGITPPVIFPRVVGGQTKVVEMDVDATPRPASVVGEERVAPLSPLPSPTPTPTLVSVMGQGA